MECDLKSPDQGPFTPGNKDGRSRGEPSKVALEIAEEPGFLEKPYFLV